MSLTDARAALADAVTGAGLECSPYPPDAVTPPAAYVDTVSVDYDAAASYCAGMATASVVSVAQRNDRAGSMQSLEDRIPAIRAALGGAVRLLSVESGSAEIGGQALPAVIYNIAFAVRD